MSHCWHDIEVGCMYINKSNSHVAKHQVQRVNTAVQTKKLFHQHALLCCVVRASNIEPGLSAQLCMK